MEEGDRSEENPKPDDVDALSKATLGMLFVVAVLLASRLTGGPINLNPEFEVFVFYFPSALLAAATLYFRHRSSDAEPTS